MLNIADLLLFVNSKQTIVSKEKRLGSPFNWLLTLNKINITIKQKNP
jgi:hypothetical protein